ncbi:MAG: class D beta-lactamase [Chitinophagaceae bacterium]|nr:class D beta-lactamase [Chitinophagaceae bacterium]
MRLAAVYLFILGSVLFSACSPNNVDEDDSLKAFFDEYKLTGSFGMFNNGSGKFTIYNQKKFANTAYLPASTFKIVNSLIAIETGVASGDSAIIKWDGISRGRPECDKDLYMVQAFRTSCVPWFQELARRIGEKNMQRYLDTMGYAAKTSRFVIKNDLDTFWLNGHAQVTADEQLGLVKKLYFGQLPFQKRTQEVVSKMMLMEDNSNYRLAYKTGLGRQENGNQVGWIVGWIEENKHVFFFSLQTETADPNADIMNARLAILKKILAKYGFMLGKK